MTAARPGDERRMVSKRLLKLKHDRSEMGFLSACISEEEMGREPYWTLRVESPASTEEFRVHLTDGSCMALSMVTRDGVAPARRGLRVEHQRRPTTPPRW